MTALIFLSAFLLYFANPNIFFLKGFWPLAWVFAVPLFRGLEGKSWLTRLATGIIFGLVFYGFLVQWFIPYTKVGYAVFVLMLSIQPAVFCLLIRPSTEKGLRYCFDVAVCWVISELVRTAAMSGFSWGLAASQTFNLPVLQSVSVIGGPGLAGVIIFFNACIDSLIRDPRCRKSCGWAAAAAFLIPYFLGMPQVAARSTPGIQVATVQPNIPPEEKIDRQMVYVQLEKIAAQSRELPLGLDLIVWPETAIPSNFLAYPQMMQPILDIAGSLNSWMLVGGALKQNEDSYNSAVLMDLEGKVAGIYQKRILVPFSEYLPAGRFWAWLAERLQIHHFEFKAGGKPEIMRILLNGGDSISSNFGVLICNEDTIGKFFRQYVDAGASFIVVMLNDGWFFQKTALMMHGQNAVLHAVEYGIPVLRAANTGWSCLIDPRGRIQGSVTDLQQRRNFLFDLQPAHGKTVYHFVHNYLLVVAVMGLLLSRMIGIKRKDEKTD
jgi:apolipoprotein N-acyltransferase